MQYIIKITLLLFLTFSINLSVSYARWSTIEDVAKEVKFYNNKIKINADGTYEAIIETREKILKETARAQAANYRLYYDGSNSKLTILEAKTIYNGKEYPVDLKMIEDKPLASSKQGFDEYRQVLISFPKTEIGAEIYIKYTEKLTDAIPTNFYSGKFYYGTEGYWQSSSLSIESELPLHMQVNDPEGVLEVKNLTKGKIQKIEINLIKPICKEVINEPYSGVVNPKYLSWISFSSLDKWEDLSRKLAPDYEKVINQPLPDTFKAIVEKARSAASDVDKINLVVSLLNEKIGYMGDWRSINSKLFPKSLEKISHSQIGDCKDFTVSTAAMLRALGFKAQAAVVLRGAGLLSFEDGLPDVYNFNHAFLKVTAADGKIYWIDPTNLVSMAQGIFEDVAGKKVLVLDTKNPSYERTPEVSPSYSGIAISDQIDIVDNQVNHSGYFTLKGNRAISFFETKLYSSEEAMKDFIFYILSGRYLEKENKQEMILPNVSSRIVEDITLKFKYYQNNQIIKTNFLPGIYIESLWTESIINSVPDQVSDLWIDIPRTITKIDIIKGKKIKQIESLNYAEDTSWISIKRICSYTDDSTQVKTVIVFKKPFISREELQSPEYKHLKESVIDNFQNSIIILAE